ncbi:MAG TPA: hypothetical protein VIY51_10735 [Xanthobacteraceae bacterium]
MHVHIEVTRRQSLTAGIMGMLCASAATAKDRFIRGPIPNLILKGPPLSLAVPDFLAEGVQDRQVAVDIAQLAGGILKRSGPFALIDAEGIDDKMADAGAIPKFAAWRPYNVDVLVVGQVSELPDNRLQVDVRAWAVAARWQFMGQRLTAQATAWQRIGYAIAADIYERVRDD